MGEWEDLHRLRAESKALRHGRQGRGQGPSWDTLKGVLKGLVFIPRVSGSLTEVSRQGIT